MTLSSIDTSINYKDSRNRLLKFTENTPLALGVITSELIHDDGSVFLTFGFGFNLEAYSGTHVFQALTQAYGPSATTDQTNAIALLRDWRNGTSVTLTDGSGNPIAHTITEANIRKNGVRSCNAT